MKKRLLSTFLVLCIAMTLLPVSALATNSRSSEFPSPVISSNVVPEGYIGIYTVADLINCTWVSDKNYILMADLDMGSSAGAWNPVEFRGVLDGNGHFIKNLHISEDGAGEQSSNSYCYGLFSSLYGTVKNLALSDISIEVTGDFSNNVCVGSIAGEIGTFGATIENCYVTGQVTVTPNITSDIYSLSVGGLVGTVSGSPSTILSSANYATISVQSTGNPEKATVGGLMGSQSTWANTMSISKSINSGTITADGSGVIYAGGIAGTIRKISISCCKNTGEISATASSSHIATGGVVGWADGSATSTISQCCNLGNVSGTGAATSGTYGGSGVGGILGGTHYQHVASIEDNYNSGDISLEDTFRGLSGYASKAGGVGGILGQDCKNDTSIKTSYSYGAVTSETASSNVVISDGGIIGFAVTGDVQDCFWRFDTTDVIGSSRNGSSVSGGGVLTTGNADNQDTYSGFDFNSVWTMGAENYTLPILQWENTASSYSVSYNLDGGSGDIPATQSYALGSTVLITSTIPTKEGYVFNGWSDGSSTYQAGETFTMPEKNVSLTAVWAQSSNDGESANITNLYPANGATEVGYGANSPKKFQITFDREIANDGAIAQVDLSRPGAFSVYRASDDQPVYQSTQYSTHNFLIVYQQENILSIASTELDPGTEYYITLAAGIVAFKDETTNQAISKGDWGFSTKLFEKEGDFSYLSNDGYDTKYGYSYSDSYFEGLSNKYNHELANMSISLALSAFNSASSLASGYEHTTAAKNVRALLSDIKFDNLETSSYTGRPGKDTIGVAFGKKEVSYSSGDYTLVAVAIRGAGYEAEWGGNLTVGRKGNHTGFQTAADTVLSRLKEYIKNQEISGDLKIWVTGYSRAAATANLVAAALDDGELFSGANPVSQSSVSLKRTDIYAYTFETPMATTNSNSSAYDNIFNIVNPIDPVPKVAPEGWNFTRYGVTYYMPTSEELTFSDYRNIILRVNTEYANIIKVTPGSSSSFIKALSNQGTVLNSFLNYLSVKLPRNTYSPGYEDLIAPIIAEVTNSGKTDAEAIASIVLEFCVRHPKEAKRIIDALEDAVGSKVFWFVVAEQGFEQLYKILGWEGTTATEVITLLFDTITQSHIPEVTLAWMRTINGADEYGSGMARKLYVNCPVNVSVYDSSNQLVAQIINDEPQLIDDSLIGTYVDGSGQKIIILPNNEKYRIVLAATDDGTVTYTATEYSLDTGNSERVVSYYEVEVFNGDELMAIAENLSEVSFAEYPLYINDSNKPLEPTINQIGDDVVEYTVAVTVLGNGEALGGGSYISGEFARVIAEPNSGESFLGWYIGNTLTSSDAEYRFLVKEDVDIIAKFTTNTPSDNPDPPSKPTTPSTPSGGGSSSNSSYSINVPSRIIGGSVSVQPTSASAGNKVTITVKPDSGYDVGEVTVTDKSGKEITVINVGDGNYTFIMPKSKVDVKVEFVRQQTLPTFTDVQSGAYYYDAVAWAVEKGITAGTSATTFSPDASCTRAQIVTFLWRAAGSPKASVDSPFTDVPVDSYYYNAVLWAVEQGITSGTSATTFSPNATCTRAQAVTFLYRYEKSPAVSETNNFTDVDTDAYYADAVQWAVDKNVTAGTSATTFSPNATCTRAQIVTFLYRDMA